MSEDRLLKARTDGSRAQSLLNDELLQDAFKGLKQAYSEKLLTTSIEQSAARETLYQAHRLVGEVENHLRHILDNGKLAEAELNRLIALREPKKRFGVL
jgi:hypothetical protein